MLRDIEWTVLTLRNKELDILPQGGPWCRWLSSVKWSCCIYFWSAVNLNSKLLRFLSQIPTEVAETSFKWLLLQLRDVLFSNYAFLKDNVITQWCSGRSMTAHIVFDLRSLIWGFGESCTIVHGITSEPENALSNVVYWYFRRSPAVWLQSERETFRTPQLWRVGEHGGSGEGHSIACLAY